MALKKNNKRHNSNTDKKKGFLQDEIAVLATFAICVLLLLSNFGVCGYIGDLLSSIMFGMFGTLAYVFPILLFMGVAFVKSNKGTSEAYIKTVAAIVLCLMLCTLFQLIMNTYIKGTGWLAYYKMSRIHKDGGGLVGGIIVSLLCPAIGLAGTYIVTIIISIICMVIITERSFLSGVKKRGSKVYATAKEDVKRRKEQAEIRKQIQEEEQRKLTRIDNKVSGVSFDTAIAKKSPEMKEIKSEDVSFSNTLPEDIVINGGSHKNMPNDSEHQDIPNEVPAEKPSKKRKTKESQTQIDEATADVEQEIQKKTEQVKQDYKFPPFSILAKGKAGSGNSDIQLRQTAMKLQQTLHNFGVNVTITNISCGPTVTRYELQPEQGVKVSKIVGLADDIKLNLAASDIRIEAPIPGKAAVGIEVPNQENTAVYLRDLLETTEFKTSDSDLSFAVGRDIAGKVVVTDIAKMPHLLIAGATGSGKSVCINTLIMSLLYKASPDDVKLIMVDPKVVELSVYNGIPHLLIPVVTDPKKAAGALNWAVAEMTKRYQLFAEYNVRNLKAYNAKVESIDHIEEEGKPEKMPQIVIIVDELADLMMVAPGEVEDAICRLAQLARAAGIHLVVATQRPSVNVITGLIKANMPSRIAFAVSSGVDSRTILDMNGAEKLLGKGDMLFYPSGLPKPVRVQGSFVSDKEVQSVVEFLVNNNAGSQYNDEITKHVNNSANASTATGAGTASDDRDVYFVEAGKFVIEKDKASIGMLQRVFKIGFNRAARIMDQLAEAGVVGEEEGTKPRKVLMSMEEFEQYIEDYV